MERVKSAGVERCGAIAGTALLTLLLAGCATRTVTERYHEDSHLRVSFRSEKKILGSEIPRGYDQPAAIATERLAHILSVIDISTRDGESTLRRPAVASELLLPVSKVLSEAFASANANQQISVVAVRKQRRLGLFHKKFLTSFVTYTEDDLLYVHLSRVEWEVPKKKENDLPEPNLLGGQMDFRTVPGRAMHGVGAQGVAVDWRSPMFGRPLVRSGDEVERRTVLFESAIPQDERASGDPADPSLPDGLSPELLRELADLEEARRRGDITESYYQARREKLLGGGGPAR